jgi:hypothetical protein
MEDPTAEVAAARAKSTKAEQAKALGDALNQIPSFATYVKELRRDVVRSMHEDDDMSWADIGEAIGQHRNRAAQIARGVAGGAKKKAPPDGEAGSQRGIRAVMRSLEPLIPRLCAEPAGTPPAAGPPSSGASARRCKASPARAAGRLELHSPSVVPFWMWLRSAGRARLAGLERAHLLAQR